MKKFLLSIAVAMLSFCTAMAQDISTIPDNSVYTLDLTATAGSQATLSIHLKNSTPTQGVQITMTLPEGITMAKEGDDYCIDKGAHAQKGQDPEANFVDGVYMIGVLSTGGREYPGTEGEIITCVLDIAATVSPGDYEVKLTGVETNGISGVISKKGTHDYTGKITITAATGINDVDAGTAPTDIYSANGMKQKSLQKGLNIVKRNGRVMKVIK